jgi:hypothetical protein
MLGYNPIYLHGPRQKGVTRLFTSYAECARVWVRQTQDEGAAGRMPGGSMRMKFDGPVIYSYGRHFPLARIIYNEANVAYVLVNGDSYSVTTSRHQAEVRSAINSYMGERHSVFYVNTRAVQNCTGKQGRDAVYAYYEGEFAAAMRRAETPRLRHATREALRSECVYVAEAANRFARVFGDPVPFPTCEAECFAQALDEYKEAA